MAPVSINRKKLEISHSNLSVIVNLIILFFYMVFNKQLTETVYSNHEFYPSNNIMCSSETFLFLKTYFLISLSILWGIVKAKQWIYCVSEFKIVINLIRKEIFIFIFSNRIYNLIYVQMFVWISFLTTSYLYCFLPKKSPSLATIFFYLPLKEYPICIINMLVTQQHLITVFIESSLKALNIYLQTQVNISNNSDLSDLIDKVAEIHFRIMEISKYFYKHFSFLFLMICFDGLLNYTFEAFLVYLYSMMYYRGKVDGDIFKGLIINTVCLGGYSVLRIIQIIIILNGRCRGQNEVSFFV